MKAILLTLTLAGFSAFPLTAQEAAEDNEGFSLMEEGAKLFMRGIIQEMEPAMKDLQGLADDMEPTLRQFAQEMGPAFADLLGKIDNLNAYHPPEIMPNGDIILRKKTPEEVAEGAEDEIEI